MARQNFTNVKDFGVRGDGTTDDRAAIQTLIDLVASAGGGTLWFPRGTYLVTESGSNGWGLVLNNQDKVQFLGEGSASIIKQSGTAGSNAFDLIRIKGGSEKIKFEDLTFDQSGLTSPGSGVCHLINIEQASYVKIVDCIFSGQVASAGSYIYTGGTVNPVTLVWIDGCDIRGGTGGPAIFIDGNTSVAWVVDTTIVQTGNADSIVIEDTVSEAIEDIKICDNNISNDTKYALRIQSSDVLNRIQVYSNTMQGFVKASGLTKSQIQNNQIYANIAVHTDPALLVEDCSIIQVQGNIVSRGSTCAGGYVVKADTCTDIQIQDNNWIQEKTSSVAHVVDCNNVQITENVLQATDAGSSANTIYLIEAASVAIDNIQVRGDLWNATAGTWQYGVHIKSNTAAIGVVQVIPGVGANVATGVYFNENGGGAGKFTVANGLMVAGGLLDCSVAAWAVSASGIYIRIGGNASTFQPNIIAGNGSPEGAVTSRVGSVYLRLDGGTSTTLYIKESGTSSTGWAAK